MAAPTETFSRQRLRVARVFNGYTRDQLASMVGTSTSFLSRVEAGERNPAALLVEALAETLGVLPGFFHDEPVDEFRENECHFRNRHRVGAKVHGRVLAHATMFGLLVEYLERQLRLPKPAIPPQVEVRSEEDIERAAERCRMEWGLGLELPLANVTKVAERAGIVVALLRDDVDKVDAFSCAGRRPIAVLSWKEAASRNCFSLAHEIGHLLMHGDREPGAKSTEAEADSFASAFLMPRAGFAREFPRGRVDWRVLLQLKARWRVSLAAMVRRAHQLGLITASQYTSAYKAMSYRGWRKQEPGEFEFHPPQMISKSFAALADGYSIGPSAVAAALDWRRETLDRVLGPAVELPSEPAARNEKLAKVIPLRR